MNDIVERLRKNAHRKSSQFSDTIEWAAADTIKSLRAENAELREDVALWKREAADRSQGMIDLNLDRADMGVENVRLSEERDTLVEAVERARRHADNIGITDGSYIAQLDAALAKVKGGPDAR